MTSLEPSFTRVAPYTVPTDPTQNTKILVQGKEYIFSKAMVTKYPKLLDPDVVFLLNMDSILPLIYEYPPSCIDPHLLDENHEKQKFLADCDFLGITLPDAVILHLSKNLRTEIETCSDHVRKVAKKRGTPKMRFIQRQDVHQFCFEFDSIFQQHGATITPLDVISHLEMGTKAALDKLVILDFSQNNLILSMIHTFTEKFLPEVS